MFFDGSMRSTLSTRRSGRVTSMRRSAATTGSLTASASNSAQSMEIGRLVTVVVCPRWWRRPLESRSAPTTSAARAHKFLRQRSVCTPTTSFASRPSWIASRIAPRQHRPGVRLRPRDVHELREHRVGRSIADEARCEVEVVVVEEDGCVAVAPTRQQLRSRRTDSPARSHPSTRRRTAHRARATRRARRGSAG